MPFPNQGPTSITVIGPGGRSGPGFFNIVDVTWDATGCNPVTGLCPAILQPPVYSGNPTLELNKRNGTFYVYPIDPSVIVSGGNTAVGVEILGFGLTAIPFSGFPNQGACIDPVFGQAITTLPNRNIINGSGIIYFEIGWSILQDTNLAGGMGLCPLSKIGQWDDIAGNATSSIILRPDGTIWQNGLLPSNVPFPSQQQGDIVGISVTFLSAPNLGIISVIFSGVAGSILGKQSDTIFMDMLEPCVPCVVFDTTPVNLMGPKYAATATFSQRNQGAFAGPKNLPNDFDPNGAPLGWPALEIPQ